MSLVEDAMLVGLSVQARLGRDRRDVTWLKAKCDSAC